MGRTLHAALASYIPPMTSTPSEIVDFWRGSGPKAWFAKSALWSPDTRIWTFYTGAEVAYENGGIVGMKTFE